MNRLELAKRQCTTIKKYRYICDICNKEFVVIAHCIPPGEFLETPPEMQKHNCDGFVWFKYEIEDNQKGGINGGTDR